MKFVKYKLIPRKNGMHIRLDDKIDRSKYDFKEIFFPLDILDFNIAIASDNFPLVGFSAYQMQEITKDEALSIIQQRDPDATLSDDGQVSAPNILTSEESTDE